MHAVVSDYMGNDFFAKGEKSIFMGFFIFMDVYWRYFESIIAFGFYFFIRRILVILPDVYHQHMQMQ